MVLTRHHAKVELDESSRKSRTANARAAAAETRQAKKNRKGRIRFEGKLPERLIESANPDMVRQLEAVYKRLGADRQAHFQTFCGNHIRKLLSGNGPEEISNVIKDGPCHSQFRLLLTLLGKMQSLAKAEFLVKEEVVMFKSWTRQYFSCIRNIVPSSSVTVKNHLLCFHVADFMEEHSFWGLLSEQSIEALHCKVNSDERRFACVRDRREVLEKIMKQSYIRNILCDLEIRYDEMEFEIEEE